MTPNLKRKLEDQSMSNEAPQAKKSRLTEVPKPTRWSAPDFDQEVYTPVESLLPSPFGNNLQPGKDLVKTLRQFGPVIQTTYETYSTTEDRPALRENLQGSCNDQQILWLDPLQSFIVKSGETLMISQGNGETRTIRFRRVISELTFHWFAFVQKGTVLSINGQSFPSSRDYVAGPFPSFSILEYDQRCVFLCLSRDGVDYTPSSRETHETTSRMAAAFAKEQERKKASGESAGSSSSKSGSSKSEADDSGIKLRFQPERQPEDIEACEYFQWRLQEWKTLRDRAKVELDDQAPKYPGANYQEWLTDSVVYRAIASVTTAIELENDVPFAQIDEASYQQARHAIKPQGYDNSVIGPRAEFLLPFNSDNRSNGSHWVLVHAKMTETGPEIHCYDSAGITNHYDSAIRLTLRYSLWYGSLENQPGLTEVTHHAVPIQPGGWECGYFTIMNAWCLALGMTPSAELGTSMSKVRILDLIDMINLSMSGFMDSATIQAFMRCTGFVEQGSDTIAGDRHFTRSVPFLNQSGMNKYINMRRDIEQHPNSGTKRLDIETIRYILRYTGHEVENLGAEAILERFDKWLKDNNIIEAEPTSPFSPISPKTIEMCFTSVTVHETQQVPVPWPTEVKALRKVWRVYHKLLRREGLLACPLEDRAAQKEAGAPSTQEGVPRDDTYYPYESAKIVTLDRLGMLPSTDVLSPTELAGIRTKKSPVKIILRATR
ncbi:hypothetical protein D6D06_00743 [Aureobasidium pullulans]|nr:hypothetical protein D6D06_00743 [Aureobasidium pullulans]